MPECDAPRVGDKSREDIFLTQMQDWFKEHMPGVNAEVIRLSSVYTRDDPETWEKIKANGHAAIVGVGH